MAMTPSGQPELSTLGTGSPGDFGIAAVTPCFCSMWEGALHVTEIRHLSKERQYVRSINRLPQNPFLLSKIQALQFRKINTGNNNK